MAQQERTMEQGGPFAWLKTEVDGQPVRNWLGIALAIAVAVIGFGAFWTYGLDRGTLMEDTGQPGMGAQNDGMGALDQASAVPPVQGFYQGEEILFVHTEASDPQVAQMLTDMMGSPVLVVPELAQVPEAALAKVYVFTNGVQPDAMGPMGFQPDVFDSAPEDEGYSLLRAVHFVTWKEGVDPRLLKSAEDIETATNAGEVSIERPGAVVSMPFLTWPGGQR